MLAYLNFIPGSAEMRKKVATRENLSSWKEVSNLSKTPRVVVLPDHSTVTLSPETRLRFLAAFDGRERVVYLDGEGFFEVARNIERPFFVHTSSLTMKVLGTSFTIKAFQKLKRVIVEVKTGKVSVRKNDGQSNGGRKVDEIILTPNQKIVYDNAEDRLSRMIVDAPQAILPAEEVKRMRFENAPVAEVFQAIEKVYGVDIVYDEGNFSNCRLTTSISDGGIYNRLDIICKAMEARYEMAENQIVVTGPGCN